jgi:hypothetical protein
MIVINKTKYSMGCLILAKIDPQLFYRFSVFTDSMIWKTMNGPSFFFEIKGSSLWLDNRSPAKSFLLEKILSCRHIISYTLIKQNPTSQFLLFHSPPRHHSLLAHASTISLSIQFHQLAKSLPFIIDPILIPLPFHYALMWMQLWYYVHWSHYPSTMHLCVCSYATYILLAFRHVTSSLPL